MFETNLSNSQKTLRNQERKLFFVLIFMYFSPFVVSIAETVLILMKFV